MQVTEVDNPPKSWDIKKEDKPAAAESMKSKGNDFFKRKKLQLAVKLYTDALAFLNDDDLDDKAKALKVSLYSNQALVQIKQENWSDAKENVEKGLELEKNNLKLLYRKAQCFDNSGDYDECLDCLKEILKQDEKNAPALRMVKSVKKKNKAYLRKKRALAS